MDEYTAIYGVVTILLAGVISVSAPLPNVDLRCVAVMNTQFILVLRVVGRTTRAPQRRRILGLWCCIAPLCLTDVRQRIGLCHN